MAAGVFVAGVLVEDVFAPSGRDVLRATVSAAAAEPRVVFADVAFAAAFAGAAFVAAVFVGAVLLVVDVRAVDAAGADLAAVDLLAADFAADVVGADLLTAVFAAGLAATRFAPVFAVLAGFAVVDVALVVRPDGAVAAAALARPAVLVAPFVRPV